jgi:hypothetical protein
MTERKKLKGPFTIRPVEMLKSPAFRVLSLSGHRILARLEIELARHGGKGNGQLIVTHENFRQFGVHHNAVGPAIRESEALGFINVTRRGSAGNAQHRRPNTFRVAYLPTDNGQPTHDWKQIASLAEAEAIAAKVRDVSQYRKRVQAPGSGRTRAHESYSTGKRQSPVPENGTENGHFPVPETGNVGENPQYRKPVQLSRYLAISTGKGRRAPAARPSRAANPKPPRRH